MERNEQIKNGQNQVRKRAYDQAKQIEIRKSRSNSEVVVENHFHQLDILQDKYQIVEAFDYGNDGTKVALERMKQLKQASDMYSVRRAKAMEQERMIVKQINNNKKVQNDIDRCEIKKIAFFNEL